MRVALAHNYLACGPLQTLPGVEPGYWLLFSRGRGDQNIGATIDGVAKCPGGRLVVIGHPITPLMAHDPRVHYTGGVSDAELRWAYANARGLIAMSPEDFGRTPIEANSFGTPVVALRSGGLAETVIEGVTGVFVDRPVSFEIARALRDFPTFDADEIRRKVNQREDRRLSPRMCRCRDAFPGSTADHGRGWLSCGATRSGGST